MGNITDRTAYLRGLAEGLTFEKDKPENRLLLEMLTVMDEMAQKIAELDSDLGELDEYVESIDSDLGDIEDALFGDDDDLTMTMKRTMMTSKSSSLTKTRSCPSIARTAVKPCKSKRLISTLTKARCAPTAISPFSRM